MDSSDVSRVSDVSVSLADLKNRLRALQDDKGHYVELAAKANGAFEAHRVELTQLRQKERAVFTANEDRLRGELQSLLAGNRALMERLALQNKEREEALKAQLLHCRRESSDNLTTLQAELDELWRQRRAAEADVLRATVEKDREEEALLSVMGQQEELHNTLQLTKEWAQEELDEALAAEDRSAAVRGSPCCCGCGADARWRPASSPGHLPRVFVPSGPKGKGGVSACVDSMGGGDDDNEDGGGVPCGPCPRHRHSHSHSCSRKGSGSPRRQRRFGDSPASVALPATHNVQAILSTIERHNYLKPRDYLRRHGNDLSTHDGYGDSAVGGLRGEIDGTPLRERLERMRRQHLARKEAERAVSPVLGTYGTSSHLPTSQPPPACAAGNAYVDGDAAHTPQPPQWAPQPPPPSEEGLEVHSHRTSSPPRYRQRTPPPSQREVRGGGASPSSSAFVSFGSHSPYNTTSSGRAINAACDTVLDELQELRRDYAERQRRLRDPQADSIQASRDMRRILAAMDRKADQLRALRSEQRLKEDRLHARDVLDEVIRENRYCEGVYNDIVQLIRS